ncbi:MAG: DUF5916 domain-containing protein [Myxococcota bacterium]
MTLPTLWTALLAVARASDPQTLAAEAGDSLEVGSVHGEVRVDGRLDEADWAAAPMVTDFLRFQPLEGGAPPGVTEVRFLQDDKNLYVGVRVRDAGYRLRARVSQRESINADDQIGIYLDTFSDRISGYIFYFNAIGIQQDIRHNAGKWNVSWDTVIRSKGHVSDDGFELEVAFPWRSLKFPGGGEAQDWGVIVTRKVPHEGAKYSWPQLERNAPRIFATANRLVGVRPPSRGSGFEIVPSITGFAARPVEEPPDLLDTVRPSLDVRFGITPDLGIAATLNPDFSQVESDVSDIRLNARFAFDFPERRPFFLDGVDWFEDRGATLYTRSMNQPVYGVKVGGREGPLTLGALHVLDRSPLPTFTEGGSPGFDAEDVEGALASSTLVRARTDAFGLGYAGLVMGDKRILGGGSHQIGGVDFEVPLGDRWFAGSSFLHSSTGDDEETLWGMQQNASLSRASGIGTGMTASFTHRTPGFRKELGFLTQSDITLASASVDHTFTPRGVLDTWTPAVWVEGQQEGNGDRYAAVGHDQSFLMDGIHTLSIGGWTQTITEQGVKVDGAGARLAWASNLGRAVDMALNATGGSAVDYGLLLPATNGQVSVVTTLRPTPGIRTDTEATVRVHHPKGEVLQRTQLVRNRVNWQFTPDLGMRWVLDYSAGTVRSPRIYNALLLTWLRNPGTAIWLGGSVVSIPSEQRVEQTVFAKATLLLRP